MDHLILSKNKKEKESQHLNHQLSRQTDNSWRINKTNFKPKGDNNQYGKIGDKICTHLMEIIMPVFYINVLKWIYLEDENSKTHRFMKSLL